MTNEYVSTMKTNEDIEFKGVTLIQKEDEPMQCQGADILLSVAMQRERLRGFISLTRVFSHLLAS